MLEPGLRGGQGADLAILDQRADPVGLPPLGHGVAQLGHDLVQRADDTSAVVIGLRPGGFSSSTATSMSPYCARASDRGIGVAVITSTSAPRPWPPAPRAAPRRTGAARRPRPSADRQTRHPSGTPHVCRPECRSLRRQGRAFRSALRALVAPGHQPQPHARRLRHGRQAFQMLPRQYLGRRHQHTLPAGFHRDQQRQHGDQRLAGPDVALQQPVHAPRAGHVGGNLASARVCAPVGGNPSDVRTRSCKAPCHAWRDRVCAALAPVPVRASV